MPGARGRWNASTVARWLLDTRGIGDSSLSESLLRAKTARTTAQGEIEKIRLARLRGELIERTDVEAQIRELVSWFDLALRRIQSELRARLVGRKPREMRGEIDRFVAELRREIAENGQAKR